MNIGAALCSSAADVGAGRGGRVVQCDDRCTLQPGAQVDAFCDALRLFKLGYSWGGPISLVVPCHLPACAAAPHRT